MGEGIGRRAACGLLVGGMAACGRGFGDEPAADMSAAAPTPVQAPVGRQAPPRADLPPAGNPPVVGQLPPMPPQREVAEPPVRLESVAQGLSHPWGLDWAPDGRMFLTERAGRLRIIENGTLQPRPYHTVDTVDTGEGGLMGLALHPSYPDPPWVYLMWTYRERGRSLNGVARFVDTGSGLGEFTVIQKDIPGAWNHNGGGVKFGPDGMLYVSCGDAAQPELSQDMTSAAGKILRYTPEGGVPADNPFPGSPIYALGIRNCQGMAWHPDTGRLWITTHGPSGEFPGLHHKDGVYELTPGANCGWPRVIGAVNRPGVTDPVLWYPDKAVPPGDLVFYTGDKLSGYDKNLFFASLGARHLQRVVLNGEGRPTAIERWWPGRLGRLRLVAQGPDGYLYLGTSRAGNRNADPKDDEIFRIAGA